MKKIGLIAGNRRFPFLSAEAARMKGYSVVAVAIKGDTSPVLRRHVDRIYWLKLAEFRKMLDVFKAEGINKVVMAGQISPHRLFGKEMRSPDLKKLFSRIEDWRANTIFRSIADELQEAGLELLDSTIFLDDYLPAKGVLTRKKPDAGQKEDIDFGFALAKKVALLDIGLSVGVKNKAIVAVEALEGTDNLIRRAGKIARRGVIIVKVSRPNQDNRFDIPVIGLGTIQTLISSRAACMAIEAKKTLFIDMQQSLALADRKGIGIVSV
ncbi:MAG: UDP-2,3-diacylglucosamine diphosphatase LpxI [Candidatus Omnitrophica bacterium]|nr:UDP-2,3-diacylglucosamine diphosphatase LpxI [Candidatus Omnitrophota bacterium]